ncbi:MAG: aminopeptidase [Deltaproteobacteria bacterium]|nr:aminopeptidase [Deltaproteobacteria bacterium]
MLDFRMEKLAQTLVRYSCRLKRGEKILIEAIDIPDEMVALMIRAAADAGGVPLVTTKHNRVLRELYRHGSEESMKLAAASERLRMEKVQAYVGLRGSHNINELADVPQEKIKLYQTHWLSPVHFEVRVPKTKWVVLRWPSPSMAQQAKMSTDKFEDFYFSVCCLDYGKMAKAMDPLQELMEKTDQVQIVAPGTDLKFSIKGIAAVKCSGLRNIPDGEIFTAPIKDSVHGTIRYNTRSLYLGTEFSDIAFTFKKGKIVKAAGNPQDRVDAILDSDAGARYLGEFAIGVNPYVTRPMLDTLFDEKIAGSVHVTPGSCYDEASNGNKSQVHWDLVLIQTPEWGGGELYFDGKLVRKDGRFVPKALQRLNPENLM